MNGTRFNMGIYEDMGIVFGSSYGYRAAGDKGLEAYSFNNSTSLSFVDADDQGGIAENVVVGEFIFLANGSMGALSYKMSPERTLQPISYKYDGIYGKDISLNNKIITLSDSSGGSIDYTYNDHGVLILPEPIPEPIPDPEPDPEPDPPPKKGKGKALGKKKLKK